MSFEECRVYARSLKLKSAEQWTSYGKSGQLDLRCPHGPDQVYKTSGWTSWPDFLGTCPGGNCSKWMSFEECRVYAQSLKLKSSKQWIRYGRSGKLDLRCPQYPDQVYKTSGWISWRDFLGYIRRRCTEQWMSFEECRVFARSLQLKSAKQWKSYCKSGQFDLRCPRAPDQVYKTSGWISWPDFLGTCPEDRTE